MRSLETTTTVDLESRSSLTATEFYQVTSGYPTVLNVSHAGRKKQTDCPLHLAEQWGTGPDKPLFED
jgi:hypothetical protein